MKAEILKDIQEYISNNEIEIEDVDLGENEKCDIKTNPILLAEFYVKYYNEYIKVFKECKIFEVEKFFEDFDIYTSIYSLSTYKKSNIEFGKTRSEEKLKSFVIENLMRIQEFVDFWWSVTVDKSQSLDNALEELNKVDKEDGEKK